VCIFEIIHIS